MTLEEIDSLVGMLLSEDFDDAVLAYEILSKLNPNPLSHPVLFSLDKDESKDRNIWDVISKISDSKIWTKVRYYQRLPGYYRYKKDPIQDTILLELHCDRWFERRRGSRRYR